MSECSCSQTPPRVLSSDVKVTVLVGGVGGARFLLGVQQLLGLGQFAPQQPTGHELTAVVNIGDDAWIHGLRVCPDLDTCMYTLGGGVDPQRGWGHRDETWHAMAELARYGVQPDWFELGDRDLATHLVRTQMLDAGYPLSQVTAALCDRWQPGARLLPASDDRCETHAVITDPADDSRRAIHFQEWWVRYRAQLETHSFAFVGAEKASATTEAVDAIKDADVIMLAPSNPVVSVGAVLAVPGIRAALRAAAGPVVGYSPIIGGKPLRGMADKCLSVIGVESTAEAVGRHYGVTTRHRDPRLLAGERGRPRGHRGRRGAVDPAVDERPEGDCRHGRRWTGACGRGRVSAATMQSEAVRRSGA